MRNSVKCAILAGALACGPAIATPIQGSSLQNLLDSAGAVVDVVNDQYRPDERWTLGALGLGTARISFELAGFAAVNAFGIYDVFAPERRLTLFSGSKGPGASGLLQLTGANQFCVGAMWEAPACATFTSDVFGFFLESPAGIFFSEQKLNSDGVDHMVAYQGGEGRGTIDGRQWLANEFLLAWEDLYGGGDGDYEDFGILVESVMGVPEPGTLALFGLGLIGAVLIGRRRVMQPVHVRAEP